jgi:hypothetical protein
VWRTSATTIPFCARCAHASAYSGDPGFALARIAAVFSAMSAFSACESFRGAGFAGGGEAAVGVALAGAGSPGAGAEATPAEAAAGACSGAGAGSRAPDPAEASGSTNGPSPCQVGRAVRSAGAPRDASDGSSGVFMLRQRD